MRSIEGLRGRNGIRRGAATVVGLAALWALLPQGADALGDAHVKGGAPGAVQDAREDFRRDEQDDYEAAGLETRVEMSLMAPPTRMHASGGRFILGFLTRELRNVPIEPAGASGCLSDSHWRTTEVLTPRRRYSGGDYTPPAASVHADANMWSITPTAPGLPTLHIIDTGDYGTLYAADEETLLRMIGEGCQIALAPQEQNVSVSEV
jgi:hypothetical protein